MKSIFKIYWRYVWTACMLVMFVACINLVVLMGYGISQMLNGQSASEIETIKTGRYQSVADELARTENGYVLSEGGVGILQENHCAFSFLLDGSGQVVWSWQLPDDIPDRFSAGEIGAFSKWYLKDFPVVVWRYGEDGLLVLGYPKGSMVRYNLYWKMNELEAYMAYVPVFVLFNAGLVAALSLLFGFRFYRSLKPVGEGIDALAEGRSVRLKEKGLTQYLKEKINQTSQLLEKQQEELQKRDRTRTDWIAGVSHDIRTPLSLIVGYADEIATDACIAEKARERAGMIRTQSFVIKKLIEDLNLTSKLTYHMQPLRKERYVPAVWLRQSVALMLNGGEIPENYELELETEAELEQLSMTGDVQLLTRALQNLLGNSVRHNPGGCRIGLHAEAVENGFCFCVRDSGKGVPEEVRRIVQEGARSFGNDRAPHVMGLLVVKQIACAHGGSLWFEEDGNAVWMSVKGE